MRTFVIKLSNKMSKIVLNIFNNFLLIYTVFDVPSVYYFSLYCDTYIVMCTFVFQLSPALRNRFVEIWCRNTSEDKDLCKIIQHNLKPSLHSGVYYTVKNTLCVMVTPC